MQRHIILIMVFLCVTYVGNVSGEVWNAGDAMLASYGNGLLNLPTDNPSGP